MRTTVARKLGIDRVTAWLWGELTIRELAAVAVFATTAKISSIAIALMGGGMNPLSLALKNVVFTALLVVLLTKVRRPRALTLFALTTALISLLLLGRGMFLAPASIVAGLVGELVVERTGGFEARWAPIVGAAVFDLVSKSFSLGLSLALMREQEALAIVAAIVIGIGYAGSLAGLLFGRVLVKELRHAGLLHA
jgi:energy-coupling factor transport system substrate-specific component